MAGGRAINKICPQKIHEWEKFERKANCGARSWGRDDLVRMTSMPCLAATGLMAQQTGGGRGLRS